MAYFKCPTKVSGVLLIDSKELIEKYRNSDIWFECDASGNDIEVKPEPSMVKKVKKKVVKKSEPVEEVSEVIEDSSEEE